ncbi:MAG: hypothetical protein H7124_15790 [Phycisphaerales bacterium]|nr:hypothetical protein [Hyphomonadaceae bacterium]
MNIWNFDLRSLAAASILILSACSAEPSKDAGSADETTPEQNGAAPSTGSDAAVQSDAVLAVDGEGLRLFNPTSGSASPIPFGRPQADVLAPLERMRGPAGQGVNQDCGAGPVEYASWPDGLSLVFQDGRFAGWGLDGRAAGALTTASGIGPGSTRAALDAVYGDVRVTRTSLGNEFSAGSFSGVLDGPNATSLITDMWAGTSCVAR